MADPELIQQFIAITSAPRHVAEHILEAHGWNLEPSVNFYLESGGVGHGNETAGFDPMMASPARPLPADAARAPRSSPLETFPGGAGALNSSIEEEGEDLADDQALAASYERRAAARTAARAAAGAQPRPRDYFDDDWTPAHDSDMSIEGSSDAEEEEQDVEDEDEEDIQRLGRRARRRVRRNRPSGAAIADPELRQLDRMLRAGNRTAAAGTNNGDVQIVEETEPLPSLPDDVDLEEQKMLLAALTGEMYRGRIPDFATDPRYRPVQLSPGAQARENLRKEQDAAYYESLELDKLKAEEAERVEREEREAAEAERRESERIEKEAAEAAAALERTLAAKEASLPKEPPVGDPNAVQIVVRMPSGERLQRRFRSSDLLSAVFDFVDVVVGKKESGSGGTSEVQPGSYNLVSQFPRRVFQDGGVDTLAEVDLAHKQEAFFVELRDWQAIVVPREES